MSKLYAIYSIVQNEERFLGQAYLNEKDLQAIDKSFTDQLQSDYLIALTDGDSVNINSIESVEEIIAEE